jgi:hypothetical protein
MSVDWNYVYKRRSWSVSVILKGLTEKTWEAFEKFHSDRGISCPPKSLFDDALELEKPPAPVVEKTIKKPRASRTRKSTRKGTKNAKEQKNGEQAS